MKQVLNFALIGAIALTGATMFAGCSSGDETIVENNPNYNAVTNEVTAQFVLNVSSATGNTTRQSADVVQKNANFRGLKDAKLIGLSTGHSTYLAPYDGEATTDDAYKVKKTYDLGTLYAASSISNAGTDNRDNSSRRVLQLALPLQTDAMLVYARAIPEGTDEENGKVTMNITPNPENITFSLASRLGDNSEAYEQTLNMAAAIINRVMSVSLAATTTPWKNEGNNTTSEAILPAITWKDLPGNSSYALEDLLASAYLEMTTIATGEYRAGNAIAIKKMMYELHRTMNTIYGATATNDREFNAQRLAYDIKTRIGKYFGNLTAENTTSFHNVGSSIDAVGTIAASLKEGGAVTNQEDFNSKYGKVTNDLLATFPSSFGLPEGVAQLTVSDDKVFSYKTTNNSLLGSGTVSASNYMYPSELMYFDNSALRVNDAEKSVGDYPNGYSNWNTNAWSGWTIGSVVSSTRSVAVKNNINYGVAMLKSSVALEGTEFKDNRAAVVGSSATDQTLSKTDVQKFTLTGILIGGQINQLGWNYLAKTPGTADNWNYVIYDNQIPNSGKIPTVAGEENYTLVFDNYNSIIADDAQSDVYVALEFVNNSEKAFYGKGNIVPVGGTFYLVAKLTKGGNTIASWDDTYAIPPYNGSGASKEITRIFVQDFMTTATFKIGNTSLQNAFVTMPDLRSTQSSLGLSVNLDWQTGLSFETSLGL